MGRARKRLAGTLKSQQEVEDGGEDTGGRTERIFQSLQESAGKRDALWPDCDAWRPQSMFDVYYRLQRIVERDEWPNFAASLRRPLPITFRFTKDASAAFRAEGERILGAWAAAGYGTRRLGLVDG